VGAPVAWHGGLTFFVKPFRALTATFIAGLALALPAAATGATEAGDAGDLPATAQDLSGAPVDAIDGAIAAGDDQDVYRVCIEGAGTFSATTVGGTQLDTQLYLFDQSGIGVYGNDDSQATRQSTLPAFDELTPTAAGAYLLAVTPYDRDPLSAAGTIFGSGSLLAPTGPGAAEPLSAWDGREGLAGDYRITLTGTTGCAPPDETAPAVSLAPADGAEFALGAAVTVDWSCTDEGGSGLASCEGSVPDGSALDTSTPGPRSLTVTARDNAGNETVVTHTVRVVDPSPPVIDLRAPLDGAVYLLGEQVLADYGCSDDALATCAGDVPDGEPLDTSSVGHHTFTVEASDDSGNTASESAGYRVIYDFRFLWPVRSRPEVNRVRAGRVALVRFSLDGYRGRHVLAAGYPQVAEIDCGSPSEPASGERVRFRSIRRWGAYTILWKTRRSWAGTCRQLIVGLDDGTVHRADYLFTHRR
jgi:hypothetical protein